MTDKKPINLEDLNSFIEDTKTTFVRIDERNWKREVLTNFGKTHHFITCGYDNVIRCWCPMAQKSIEYNSLEELKNDTDT